MYTNKIKFFEMYKFGQKCDTFRPGWVSFICFNPIQRWGGGGEILQYPPHIQFYRSKQFFESLDNLRLLSVSYKGELHETCTCPVRYQVNFKH